MLLVVADVTHFFLVSSLLAMSKQVFISEDDGIGTEINKQKLILHSDIIML